MELYSVNVILSCKLGRKCKDVVNYIAILNYLKERSVISTTKGCSVRNKSLKIGTGLSNAVFWMIIGVVGFWQLAAGHQSRQTVQ